MTIADDWIALDTNIFIFGLREDPHFPACAELLERIGELHVDVPRQIIRELQNNLLPDEVSELFRLFNRYPERIRITWNLAAVELIEKFHQSGCKLGDAAVAAHLEQEGVETLISENRHFLSEIPGLPFRVLTAATALEELKKIRHGSR
jgi:predicted nucleic acid-binding protein